MSLILAFGLSPLGQVPAYADQPDTQAAAASALQTQAWGDNIAFTSKGVTYNGNAMYEATDGLDGKEGKDRETKAAGDDVLGKLVHLWYTEPATTSNGETTPAKEWEIIPETYFEELVNAAAAAAKEADNTLEDEAAKKAASTTLSKSYKTVAEAISEGWISGYQYRGKDGKFTSSVENAGSYSLAVFGVGSGYDDAVTYDFEVKPYDFKNVESTDEKLALTMANAYNGKAQTLAYATADDFPTISSTKKANSSDTTAFSKQLKAGDFDFVPATMKDAGTLEGVLLKGKGNYTGTLETTAKMNAGTLQMEDMFKVNGVTNSDKDADGKDQTGSKKDTIDLSKAQKNPTAAEPDPLADGKVFFGDDQLSKSDFEVHYYKGSISEKTELDAAPTAPDTGYIAVVTAISDNFTSDSKVNTVQINYDITVGNALDEIAEKADFGSATYIAPSNFIGEANVGVDEEKGEDGEAAAFDNLNPTAALVAPSSAKFISAAGADVSSIVGNNWKIKDIKAWDEDKERAFLGEAEYAKQYPHEEEPYENTDAATNWVKDEGTNGVISPEFVYTNPYNPNAADKVALGFNGLPAGDYELTVEATGLLSKGEVSGKFTVAKATASEGENAGQISIKPVVNVSYKDGDEIPRNSINHEVTMVTGVYAVNADDSRDGATAYSDPLGKDSAIAVRTLQEGADYSVTYMQDGEEVTPAEAGVYDAVFTFGGNNFETTTITKPGALVVGKADLLEACSLIEIATKGDYYDNEYMYTGSPVEPEIVFYANKLGGTEYEKGDIQRLQADAKNSESETADESKRLLSRLKLDLKAGVDYNVSYRRIGTEVMKDGKPVGVGTYRVTVTGAGEDYTTEKDHEIVFTSETEGFKGEKVGGAFKVAELDLSNDKYTTILFQDGDSWVEEYSTVLGDQTKVEPKYKVVTTATKGDENPVEISSKLYDGKFEKNTTEGVAKLTLAPKADNANVAYDENDKTKYNKKKDFYICDGSFTDEGVNAQLVLSKVTDNKAEYTGKAHDLGIKVTTTDSPDGLAVDDGSGSGFGQYKWAVTDAKGKTVAKSDDADLPGVIEVGKYTVTVSGGETHQYAGTLTAEFEVTSKEVKASDITVLFHKKPVELNDDDEDVTDYTKGVFPYNDGKQVTALGDDDDITIKVGDQTIPVYEAKSAEKASGDAYVLSGHKAKDAGTYTATIELAGNYSGSKTVTWKIEPVNIAEMFRTGGWYAVAGDKKLADEAYDVYAAQTYLSADALKQYRKEYYNVDYNGQEQKPEVQVYDAADNLIKGLDATPLYKDVTDAASDQLTAPCVTLVASGGNYTNRMPLYFMINQMSISSDRVEVSFDNDDLFYTGKPVEPKGTLTYTHQDGTKFQMTYGKDYTVEYSGDNVNVGGNATAKFVGLEPNFVGGANTFVVKDFQVQENNRAEQTITYLGEKAITKKVGDAAFKLAASTNATDGKVEFASSDEKVATVDASGNVTIVGKGSATITLSAAGTKLFNPATPVEVKLTVNDASAAPAAKTANTLKIAKAKYKVKGVSKAKKTVAGAKVKVKGQGNVTWKKVKVLKGKKAAAKNIAKKVKVNKKTGKIVLKKGLKKGTYKVTVSAQAAGDATHEASKVLKAVVTLKVKK